ncbi:MAG: hypothetical protein F6K63_29960 [Moorea sp. SIO1G6]|uniref:hypothetical protein n=1 Tax=Moorena sp. SIO1G6 TaxID=2607840 RepID=UPI0013C051B2|nr:hypothetical protein [Moorena sp. SIO1G6]NET68396.1 hypothetical protein [Moorena sp. SIO1G6]
MPLPSNFNRTEHLLSVSKKVHNQLVKEWFSGLPDDPDINVPELSARQAVLIDENDSVLEYILKMHLFTLIYGQAGQLIPVMYGFPATEFVESHERVTNKPQLNLLFDRRVFSDKTRRFRSYDISEISIRLLDETLQSFNETKAKALAQKVVSTFMKPTPFVWKKGKYTILYNYKNDYNNRISCRSKAEGLKVLNKVLEVQSKDYDVESMRFIDHDKSYPANPGTERIYGKTLSKPKYRKEVDVELSLATVYLGRRVKEVVLYDRRGRKRQSILR